MQHERIVIRRAAQRDLPALLLLERRCFAEEALPAVSLVQYLELFPSTFLVATKQEECIGMAIGGGSAEDPMTAWVLDVAVDPAERGRGVARRLLEEVIRRFRERGARRILATVAPENAGSAALLRNVGFVMARHDASYFGEGESRDILLLEL